MKFNNSKKLRKNVAFVYKNVKSVSGFSTDPTANTILMTNQSLSNLL